ncbi:MAG: hypothetical protein J7J20_02070, partial [Desulfurococcales archaeon]|nr:hypothetical protein [Desulfurococcales archaeon]
NETALNASRSALDIISEALRRTLSEVAYMMPKIAISIVIALIYFVIALVITKIVKRILNLIKVEEVVKPYVRYAIPINTVILILINLGVALIAAHTIALIVYPEAVDFIMTVSGYLGKVASVAFLIVFVFLVIDAVVERIKIERGLRGFMMLLTFLITTILIIDVTALSPEVKTALTWGLSLGIGLSIGIFTIWYFFSDILRKKSEER